MFKNGQFSAILTDSLKGKTFSILRNLDTGFYKFKYFNQFNDEFEKSIHITKNAGYEIILCADNLGDYNNSFKGKIDSISSHKNFTISVTTGGCFSVSECQLNISRSEGKYFASYRSEQKYNNKLVRVIKNQKDYQKAT